MKLNHTKNPYTDLEGHKYRFYPNNIAMKSPFQISCQ